MSTPPPAGWYNDPAGSGGKRWWDGERWTDAVQGAPSENGERADEPTHRETRESRGSDAEPEPMRPRAPDAPAKRQPSKAEEWFGFVILLAIIGFVVYACAGGGGDEDRYGDASARFACSHYRNIANEASTLTDAELRGKLQEVDRDAKVSETPGIASQSRTMLEAITAGNRSMFAGASSAFAATCEKVLAD